MSFPLPELATIPAGEVMIGAVPNDKFANTSETPPHTVQFDEPFQLGRFPVRQDEWNAFTSSRSSLGSAALPAVGISWRDANDYILWLRESTRDNGWRLPSEEEWEYACRAGSRTVFSVGGNLSSHHANFRFDESIHVVGPGALTRVDAYPANSWGLHDLHGNIYEWTSSPWRPNYSANSIAQRYTVRGGSWDGLPRLLRSSAREGLPISTKRDNLGFRVAHGGTP